MFHNWASDRILLHIQETANFETHLPSGLSMNSTSIKYVWTILPFTCHRNVWLRYVFDTVRVVTICHHSS